MLNTKQLVIIDYLLFCWLVDYVFSLKCKKKKQNTASSLYYLLPKTDAVYCRFQLLNNGKKNVKTTHLNLLKPEVMFLNAQFSLTNSPKQKTSSSLSKTKETRQN